MDTTPNGRCIVEQAKRTQASIVLNALDGKITLLNTQSAISFNPLQLNPQLSKLHNQLLTLRREVERVTQSLTDDQLNWSPTPDRWSIAQCLDHLNKVGYAVLPRFESAILQLRAKDLRSNGPFHYNLLERWFIRVMSPNPPIKAPVPSMFAPASPPDPSQGVLPQFLTLQDGLLRCVETANSYDIARVKVPSPVSPRFRPCLGAYLEATIVHQQYHWLQAKEIRAHPNFPA